MIGSNLINALNEQGRTDLLVVDDLTDGTKFSNLVGTQIADYEDKDVFLHSVTNGKLPAPDVIFHQGACSSTTEWDGRMMMRENFAYAKALFHYCQDRKIPFIYASSAAVYGNSRAFAERLENERPLNVYGYSKKLFDDYVRARSDHLTTKQFHQ